MKKRILSCILFLGLLAVFLWGLSLYFLPKNNTPEAGMGDILANGILAEPGNTLDYLVLGDSLAMTGVNPWTLWRDRGYTGYVCAATGLDPEGAAGFLDTALKHQQPKVVLLEAHQLYKALTPLESGARRVSRLIPVLEYHDNWKFLKPAQALQCVHYDNTMVERGYYLRKAVSPADPGDYMAPQDGNDPIPAQSLRILGRMADRCRERGITLVVFSLPSPANWSDAAHRAVEEVSEKMGLTYVDMNREDLGLDWSRDTLDGGDHLNDRGAEKASAFLGCLLERYGLEDRRENENYERWHRDFERFTALAADAEDTL